jgi:hypothetical protein
MRIRIVTEGASCTAKIAGAVLDRPRMAPAGFWIEGARD